MAKNRLRLINQTENIHSKDNKKMKKQIREYHLIMSIKNIEALKEIYRLIGISGQFDSIKLYWYPFNEYCAYNGESQIGADCTENEQARLNGFCWGVYTKLILDKDKI